MTKHMLVFFLMITSTLSLAGIGEKNLIRVEPDVFTIKYPEQNINIFFNNLPSDELQDVTTDTFLGEGEKQQIASLLKAQLDVYPPQFVSRYLDVDIYPLMIRNKSEFGLNIGRQIVVEVSKIKQGMSFTNSIKSALAHQVGHMLEGAAGVGGAVEDMKFFLHTTRQATPYDKSKRAYSALEQGYVSRYASGEIQGYYSASEEFAEMFAYLTCPVNREDVLAFANEHPQNIISTKISRFMIFLEEYVYAMQPNALTIHNESGYAISAPYNLDEDDILSAHELRSYASIDFEAMNKNELLPEVVEVAEPTELNIEPKIPAFNEYEAPKEDVSTRNDFKAYTVPDNPPETNYRNPATKKTKKDKDKKKNKGWIWAAVLIALAVLSE